MKSLFTGLTLAFTLCLCSSVLCAQQLDKALANPVIMQHYTQEQLQELALKDSQQLASVVYYYTQSFRIEVIDCTECIPFDSASFDVSKWEYLRKRDTMYTREFTKYGFRLTLYPINDLPYHYDIHDVPLINPIENETK